MPNWVYNGLTIEGNPDEVNKLVAQMNKPFTLAQENYGMGDITPNGFPTKLEEVKYTNPIFSFFNIIAPTDLEAYAKQPPRYDNIAEAMQHKSDSWYDFNNREWGTKWDVAVSDTNEYPDTYMEGPTENGENLIVYYNFNTAWGVPEQALTNLSSQYPDLLFTLSYEEETGWGGELEILNGEITSISEYNWKCPECDTTFDNIPECPECEYNACPHCGYGDHDDDCEANPLPPKVKVK